MQVITVGAAELFSLRSRLRSLGEAAIKPVPTSPSERHTNKQVAVAGSLARGRYKADAAEKRALGFITDQDTGDDEAQSTLLSDSTVIPLHSPAHVHPVSKVANSPAHVHSARIDVNLPASSNGKAPAMSLKEQAAMAALNAEMEAAAGNGKAFESNDAATPVSRSRPPPPASKHVMQPESEATVFSGWDLRKGPQATSEVPPSVHHWTPLGTPHSGAVASPPVPVPVPVQSGSKSPGKKQRMIETARNAKIEAGTKSPDFNSQKIVQAKVAHLQRESQAGSGVATGALVQWAAVSSVDLQRTAQPYQTRATKSPGKEHRLGAAGHASEEVVLATATRAVEGQAAADASRMAAADQVTEAVDTSNRPKSTLASRSPKQLKANTPGGTKRWVPTTREEMHQMQATLNGRPPSPGL